MQQTLKDQIDVLQRELHEERRKRRAAEREAYLPRASLHRLAGLYRPAQPKPAAIDSTGAAANGMAA